MINSTIWNHKQIISVKKENYRLIEQREWTNADREETLQKNNTASVDQDIFVIFGVLDVKRRISALEKSGTVAWVPRVDEAQANAFTTWKIELPLAVGARQQLTHKAIARTAKQ